MSIEFGILDSDGTYTKVKVLSHSSIMACRHVIMDPSHYRDDGSCKCDDPVEQQRLIAEWEYTKEDFE